MIEGELDMSLSRPRYARGAKPSIGHGEGAIAPIGHRHGHRSRSLLGSFGRVEIEVPRARLNTADGKTTEWKSKALRAYQRRTLVADALIAGSYLAGANTRRCAARSPPCLAARSQGHREPGLAQGEDRLGGLGTPARLSKNRSCGSSSTARGARGGSTVRRLPSRCSSSSACARTARRCCSPIKSMGGESTELGAVSSTI